MTGTLIPASLTITAGDDGSIGQDFVGFSYEKTALSQPLFVASNSNLIGIFKRLGSGVLRIGGNLVEMSTWNANGTGQTPGQIAPSDVDALAAFLKATGWKCLYGVNLEGAIEGSTAKPTTPALAAAEVAYVARQLDSSLLGIEIGNEPDLYGGKQSFYRGRWSFSQFLTLWSQFRDAIVAAAPGVPLTGPGCINNVATWTIPFSQAMTKGEFALLTQHYYPAVGEAPTSTAETLMLPDPNLNSRLPSLKAAAHAIGVPYRITECNSYAHGGAPSVSNAYASSLWALDYLFRCAQGGASGVNFHGGGNRAYTPIADQAGAVVGTRPVFYGILLFTLAGRGTLYPTQMSAGWVNATAYAVKTASDRLNVVVINKDLIQNLELTIEVPHRSKSATLLTMTQHTSGATTPDLRATGGVTIQAGTVNPDGSFFPSPANSLRLHGSRLQCHIPALSAALIQIL
jgi:hypothetical protein